MFRWIPSLCHSREAIIDTAFNAYEHSLQQKGSSLRTMQIIAYGINSTLTLLNHCDKQCRFKASIIFHKENDYMCNIVKICSLCDSEMWHWLNFETSFALVNLIQIQYWLLFQLRFPPSLSIALAFWSINKVTSVIHEKLSEILVSHPSVFDMFTILWRLSVVPARALTAQRVWAPVPVRVCPRAIVGFILLYRGCRWGHWYCRVDRLWGE